MSSSKSLLPLSSYLLPPPTLELHILLFPLLVISPPFRAGRAHHKVIRLYSFFHCRQSTKGIKMKLSVSAYRAQASAHKKILNSSYQMLLNYGATCTTSQSQQQTSSLGLPSVKVGITYLLTGRTFLLLRRVLKGLLQKCAC
jgi:hypothetical protein